MGDPFSGARDVEKVCLSFVAVDNCSVRRVLCGVRRDVLGAIRSRRLYPNLVIVEFHRARGVLQALVLLGLISDDVHERLGEKISFYEFFCA